MSPWGHVAAHVQRLQKPLHVKSAVCKVHGLSPAAL